MPGGDDRAHDLAAELLEAQRRAALLQPFTDRIEGFDLHEAYAVGAVIERRRRAQGWQPVGRKIGFTNRSLWERYGVDAPFWARMWDRTVQRAPDGQATIPAAGLVQPRIETEVAFGLAGPLPATDDAREALEAVAWMAPAFEIVACPFPGWRFRLADCVAAFGLHARCVVGPAVPVPADRDGFVARLGSFRARLTHDGVVRGEGAGSAVLGSPAHALAFLSRVLADQPDTDPLGEGEIITTGTIIDAQPLQPGRWHADYGDLGLPDLTVLVTP